MTFAERIKEYRTSIGLSQSAFGEKIGRQQQTIAQWEKGRNSPDPQTIALMCSIYKVSADYFLGLTDDPTPRDATADLALAEELVKTAPASHHLTQEELAAKLPEDIRDTVQKLIAVAIEESRIRNKKK